MTDIAGLSTDRLSENTSPDSGNVLLRGSASIAVADFSNTGGGYIGQATIPLAPIQKQVVNPEISVHRYTDAGAPTYARSLSKLPYTLRSVADGSETANFMYFLYWEDTVSLRLLIQVWLASAPSSDFNFFYLIHTTSIASSNEISAIP